MSPESTADAAKHAERMARARAALNPLSGAAEPDPEDLGGPIEIEGADDVLASITEVASGKWPLTNGLIRIQDAADGTVALSTGWGLLAPEDDDEGIVGEWVTGAAATLATGGVVPPSFGPGDGGPEVQIVSSTGAVLAAIPPAPAITWRNASDGGSTAEFVAAPDTTPPPPAGPVSRETAGAPVERSKVKIGIIGYTGSRRLAPYGDPEWELWGLNNLHLAEDIDPSKFDAWFDLHPRTDIVKDEVHRRWLEGGSAGLSCFVWGDAEGAPPAEWPNAVAYPTQHILDSFPGYFTNSISWMMALAITLLQQRAEEQGLTLADCELGVWGVDMATDGEYAAQRPSCEFLLGIAMGLGLKVEIPDSSDLLKTASLYGLETSPMLAKIDERIFEINATIQSMHEALAQHEAQCRQLEANINAGRGALDQLGYLRGVWFQPTNAGNSTHESPPA